ncbi:sugar nucleotide-binding protein [Cohnella mopanensis]|uniref:sugar nucleotide-binding protein n=1 Tax=Cohnella mopanensis TaxID=2911966 RepID=UPI001EF81EB5|nr:sugar nucleotide-binding protein [Cohnella mopanensis]
MAGHIVTFYLREQGHSVTAITRRPLPFAPHTVCDVRELTKLNEIISDGQYDTIVNCSGILNREADSRPSEAVFVNSFLPYHLCDMTRDTNTQVIHVSTDCVFSGLQGGYSEHSYRDGISLYDRSKALGEIDNHKDLTFRTSLVGPDINPDGIGLLNWYMKQEKEMAGFVKAIWTGVSTLTLAKAIEKASIVKLSGIYHLVNQTSINKFGLLKLFNKHFTDNKRIIHPSESLVVDKSLINNRTDFEFIVSSYETMVTDMKNWMVQHQELYPHYYKNRKEMRDGSTQSNDYSGNKTRSYPIK